MDYLRLYFNIIVRRSFIIVATFMVIAGSALIFGLYREKGYEASAIIDVQQSQASGGAAGFVQTVLLGGEDSTMMETLTRRISTERFLQAVVDEFERYSPRGAALLPDTGVLVSRIQPQVIPGTKYIAIKVTLKESEGGARNASILANLAVKMLQETLGAENAAKSSAQLDFISSKIAEAQSEIESIRSEMLRFVKESGNPDIWKIRFQNAVATKDALLEQRNLAETSLSTAEKSLAMIEKVIASEPKERMASQTVSQNPLFVSYITDLARLDVEIAGARVSFDENSTEMKRLESKREKLSKMISDLRETETTSRTISPNPKLQQLLDLQLEDQIRILRAKTQIEMLDKRLKEINQEIEQLMMNMPQRQIEFEEMGRRIEASYDIIRELLRKKVEAEIILNEGNIVVGDDQYARRGGIKFIQPAHPNLNPVSPNLRFILIIAAVVGLTLGLSLAFSLEFLDGRLRSPALASEMLGLPVLGTIAGRTGSAEEEIESIAASIALLSDKDGIKSIIFVSATGQDGKTGLALGISKALARMGRRTLLVDMDLRSPDIASEFAIDDEPGFAQLVIDETTITDAIRETPIGNLHVMPAGVGSIDPIELLRPSEVSRILAESHDRYDLILCNGPALNDFGPGIMLTSQVDATVIVADLNISSAATLTRIVDKLRQNEIKILGIVCTQV